MTTNADSLKVKTIHNVFLKTDHDNNSCGSCVVLDLLSFLQNEMVYQSRQSRERQTLVAGNDPNNCSDSGQIMESLLQLFLVHNMLIQIPA